MCARRTVTGVERPSLAIVTGRHDYHHSLIDHSGGHNGPGIGGKPAAFPKASTDNVRLDMTEI